MNGLLQNELEGEQLRRRLERREAQTSILEVAGVPQPALVLRKIPLAARGKCGSRHSCESQKQPRPETSVEPGLGHRSTKWGKRL